MLGLKSVLEPFWFHASKPNSKRLRERVAPRPQHCLTLGLDTLGADVLLRTPPALPPGGGLAFLGGQGGCPYSKPPFHTHSYLSRKDTSGSDVSIKGPGMNLIGLA